MINDKDPACINYLSQNYRQTTKRHLFKDTRKESQPEQKKIPKATWKITESKSTRKETKQ